MNILSLTIVALCIAVIGGWVANLVKLIGMLDNPVTTWFIARAIGVFAAPLGSVLGYF